MNWFVLSIITLVLYGIWGLLVRLSTLTLDWKQYTIISFIGVAIVQLAIYIFYRPEINLNMAGFNYALLAGFIVALSVIPFYLAIESGKSSLPIMFTALYPILTILLAYFLLHEQVSIFQWIGIILGLMAIILMSM
jgi:transporter family protein